MREKQIPIAFNASSVNIYDTDLELTLKVREWLNTRIEFINETWSQPSKQEINFSYRANEIADEIIKTLTHRIFNYQSKKNLKEIISNVRQNLLRQINKGTTIKFLGIGALVALVSH
jgi:hypothetical protein